MATIGEEFGRPPSEAGDYASERAERTADPRTRQSYGGAHTRQTAEKVVLAGRGPVPPDPRKYRYDVLRGQASQVPFEVSKDDRMSAEDAGDMLHRIHTRLGIASEKEEVLNAFDSALWFFHTINGGSTLVSNRGVIKIPGRTETFNFQDVRDILGVDQRRFFRAFADDTAKVNKAVLASYDPYDPVSRERYGWLIQVATERGLQRYPHLAHDSADAGTNLTVSERVAVSASKQMVISTSTNSADRARANARTLALDSYDSTTATHVPNSAK